MGAMQKKVEAVLNECLPAQEPVQLFDYGTIQGGSALATEAKRALLYAATGSSTSGHKAHDYMAVAVTPTSVILRPVAFKTGLLGMKFKPARGGQPIVLPRASTPITVGPVRNGGGMWNQQAVTVSFGLPDGTTQTIDFYDNPQLWVNVATHRAG